MKRHRIQQSLAAEHSPSARLTAKHQIRHSLNTIHVSRLPSSQNCALQHFLKTTTERVKFAASHPPLRANYGRRQRAIRSVESAGGRPLDAGAGRNTVIESLDANLVHVGDQMLGDALDNLLEFEADAELHEARVLEDRRGNSVLDAVAHLLLGLGGDADLNEAVVGVGNGLEEVGNGVR